MIYGRIAPVNCVITMTKTIFITGGSRGIGEALARMAAGKYNVVFTYNSSKEKAHILQQELDSRFGGVLAVECDVTDPDSVSSAVDAAKKRFGKIDILVNNAGVAKSGLLIDMPLDDFKQVFDVNVNGTFNVTKAVLPDMLSRGQGSIVNVSSVWGEKGASMEVAYSSSKAAVIGFTKALAKEVASMGVLVNAVAPGAVDTDMMSVYSQQEKDELCRDSIALGRLASPDEIAKGILYLAESGYCAGSVLTISAGL